MSLPSTRERNAAVVQGVVAPLARACQDLPVVLLDADRTLTADDTSRVFLRRAGGDPFRIKRRFQELGYCFESFHFHAAQHVELAGFDDHARAVAEQVELFPGVAQALRELADRAEVFVVSAGIPRVWRYVLQALGVRARVIGGLDPDRPFVFGRSEKHIVARAFRETAALLVGVGDSEVDHGLLAEGDRAVVVVNHRQNVDLIDLVRDHPALYQVVPQGTPHLGIPQLRFEELPTLLGDRPCR